VSTPVGVFVGVRVGVLVEVAVGPEQDGVVALLTTLSADSLPA
jgi:hypothetical protein